MADETKKTEVENKEEEEKVEVKASEEVKRDSETEDKGKETAADDAEDLADAVEKVDIAAGEEDADASNKFMGMKPRRRSSAAKTFAGDALNLENVTDFVDRVRASHDEEVVLFSDYVGEINGSNSVEQRAFAVTEGAVYLLDPSGFAVIRRLPFSACKGMSLSLLPDNFFALHMDGTEGDTLCLSARKTEIVTVCGDAFKDVRGTDMPVNFANEFDFKFEGEEAPRSIRFEKAGGDEGVRYFLAAPPKK